MTDLTFKIITPHKDLKGDTFHGWWFPNGYDGVGPIEHRDLAGRRKGTRRGYFPDWFVLACNNLRCPARAVVPVALITDHADRQDPKVTSDD